MLDVLKLELVPDSFKVVMLLAHFSCDHPYPELDDIQLSFLARVV